MHDLKPTIIFCIPIMVNDFNVFRFEISDPYLPFRTWDQRLCESVSALYIRFRKCVLFCNSVFLIPRPPYIFGRVLLSQLIVCIFLVSESCLQRKFLDLFSIFDSTVFGSRKDLMAWFEMLERVEFINWVMPVF